MRDILSGGKRHYKKSGSGPAAPAYSQVGIIKDATAPQTSRRNPTGGSLMQGVLQNDNQTRYFKRKYGEIQTEKMSGKKAWYKGVVQKRKGGK